MTFTPVEYNTYDFANRRHIGPSPSEMEEMLRSVGAPSLDALIDEIVPADIRLKTPLSWGKALSEQAVLVRLRTMADRNNVMTATSSARAITAR